MLRKRKMLEKDRELLGFTRLRYVCTEVTHGNTKQLVIAVLLSISHRLALDERSSNANGSEYREVRSS
jgi:hypothetical protein